MARKQEEERDVVARARLLYDAGVTPVREVMRMLGMRKAQFLNFRRRENWPLRPSPIRQAASERTRTPPKKPSRGLVARLEAAVEREFAEAETALAKRKSKSGADGMEARARVLASLVRSLAELKRMNRDAGRAAATEEEDERAEDEPPRRLAELREELAHRLERLGEEGEAR